MAVLKCKNRNGSQEVLYVVHRHYAMFTVNCCLQCKRSLSLSDKDALEVEVKEIEGERIEKEFGVSLYQKSCQEHRPGAFFRLDSFARFSILCQSAATGTYKCLGRRSLSSFPRASPKKKRVSTSLSMGSLMELRLTAPSYVR